MNLQQGAKGERPRYFADPGVDKVLSMAMALAGEVAVMRDRLDSLERMLETGQPVSRQALDAYMPDDATRAERDHWRARFLDIVLRAVHQEREALERRLNAQSYTSVIEDVESTTA
jgi:hypothetical protein